MPPKQLIWILCLLGVGTLAGAATVTRYEPVTDLNPTPLNNSGLTIFEWNGRVYYNRTQPTTGNELWVTTDAATTGTLLRDIWPGTGSSAPGSFCGLGTSLFFAATTPTGGRELWVTDGTTAGTKQVADLAGGFASSNPAELIAVGGKLYFRADYGSFYRKIYSYQPGGGNPAPVDWGGEIWSFQNSQLTAAGAGIYYVARDAAGEAQLWYWPGTGTARQVSHFDAAHFGQRFQFGADFQDQMELLENRLLFVVRNYSFDYEIWLSDGTEAGTGFVVESEALGTSRSSHYSTALGGKLLFFTGTSFPPNVLRSTNGTTQGTQVIATLPSGVSSKPAVFNGKAYFWCNGAIWSSNGTAAGTAIAVNQNLPPSASNFTVYNNRLYFSGSDQTIRSTDGTNAGARTDLTNIPESSFINIQISAKLTRLVFRESGSGSLFGSGGSAVYVGNGTAATTQRANQYLVATKNSNPTNLQAVNGRVVFRATGPAGPGLYAYDPSTGATSLVRLIAQGEQWAFPYQAPNGRQFMTVSDAAGGAEPWTSDGTPAGTFRLRDIAPGSASSMNLNTGTYFLIAGNLAYFYAVDPTLGPGLYVSNGTSAGTLRLKTIPATFHARVALGDLVAFTVPPANSSNPRPPTELWTTRGTTQSLQFLLDSTATNNSPTLSLWGTAGGKFLIGADGALWSVNPDGTGLLRLKNVSPTPYNSEFVSLPGGSHFLFHYSNSNFSQSGPVYIWLSDGTVNGTRELTNPAGAGAGKGKVLPLPNGRIILAQAISGFSVVTVELYEVDVIAGTVTLVNTVQAQSNLSLDLRYFQAGPDNQIYYGEFSFPSFFQLNRVAPTAGAQSETLFRSESPSPNGVTELEWMFFGNDLYLSGSDRFVGHELFRNREYQALSTGVDPDIWLLWE